MELNTNLLKRLPKEILQNKIEPFTRKVQNKIHCKNIESYFDNLCNYYECYCSNLLTVFVHDEEPDGLMYKYILLLISRLTWFFCELDLTLYMSRNSMLYTVYKRGFKYLDIEKRLNTSLRRISSYTTYLEELNDLSDIKNFSSYVFSEYKKTKKRLKLLWGLLEYKERLEFLEYVKENPMFSTHF